MHCNTVSGKKPSALLSSAVQIRLTAVLRQCNDTCGDLLFIQVFSYPTPAHCNTVSGKKPSSLLSSAVDIWFTAMLRQ